VTGKTGSPRNFAVTHDMAGLYTGNNFADSLVEFFISEWHVVIIYEVPKELTW
jgi:hypothetical protein